MTQRRFQVGWMGVSENRDTPKSSILIGISIINHPFWGKIPYFWFNTQIVITCSISFATTAGESGDFLKEPSHVFGKLPDSKRRWSWCFLWWFPHVSTYKYIIYTVYIEYIYIYIHKSLDSLDIVSVLYGTSEAVCFSSCMIRILLDR